MAGSGPELRSGAITLADLGVPAGHEAGFPRPVVVVAAQEILDSAPSVVHVVPLTSTRRGFRTDVPIEPTGAGLDVRSYAQCQHIRAVSVSRLQQGFGRVNAVELRQIREVLGLLLDAPPA